MGQLSTLPHRYHLAGADRWALCRVLFHMATPHVAQQPWEAGDSIALFYRRKWML